MGSVILLFMDYRYQKGQFEVLAKKIDDEWNLTSQEGEWVSPLSEMNWNQESQRELIKWVADRFPPFANTNEPIPKLFLKSEIKNKAIFFGGSFNPWHMGHRVSLDLCPAEPIIIVPDQNPWKEVHERQNIWSYYLDICRKVENSNFSVYPGFLLLDRVNPTVDWLLQIKLDSKWLLIGEDTFLGIEKWKEASQLLHHLKGLYVSPRGQDPKLVEEQRVKLKKQYPHLFIQLLDHHDYEDLSSTELRKK